MNVSYRWLESLFPAGALRALEPAELARRLTLQGLAVDEVRPAHAPFSGVVLGQVTAARPHPEADRLTLCTVVAGGDEREVVCGAPNVQVGALYGYAAEGARLPGDRKIRRAKIRGVESRGMLCSAPELGLDAFGSAEGIWPVPGATAEELGRDLRELLGLDDVILVVDVPSNRGDLLSHLGVAREAQWLAGARCELPTAALAERGIPAAQRIEIVREDPAGCSLYLGRLIDDVTVAPSPGWLQARLLAVGQRPVNNVVDATNFVMLECGQPLHPFDFDRLAGGRIVVRRAAADEALTTLDGRARALDADMTLICDAERPVAIGGVMGGLETEVEPVTRTVFLEAAVFDAARIARAVRRLGLPSEAALRFARGVDPDRTQWALDRAAGLIAHLAGGTVAPGRVGTGSPAGSPARRIPLRPERVAALVGRDIPLEEIRAALGTLGFPLDAEASAEGHAFDVSAPSWRRDVEREADLIEEVARLTGYDAIPLTPLPAPPVMPGRAAAERAVDRLAAAARGAGFDEARTPSFVAGDVLGPDAGLDILVEIRNPISKAEGFLRPYLFVGLGRAVAFNLRRGWSRAKLFEIGQAFGPPTDAGRITDERRAFAFAAAGARAPLDWSVPGSAAYDFFDARGDLEDIVSAATGWNPVFTAGSREWLHPGRQAEVSVPDGGSLGFCGELHPAIAELWGLTERLYVAEIALDAVASALPGLSVRPVLREPMVERDLALVVPAGTGADEVVSVVRAVQGVGLEHLAGVTIFDRYRGRQVEEGHVSLGVRLTFQADRSLTEQEVDAGIEHLVTELVGRGWRRR
ncbi:MAG: phenylalanine--tRNA ligase subunit beta [Gemmatimonadota bacterium]